MSNSAVAKWLEEIAAAKAKAHAKEQQQPQPQQQQQEQEQSTTSIDRPQPQPRPQQAATATKAAQYGIITSYNLRTRKKQLRLVLPPEPHKPGPGECCGNDCEPCVNTIYWEDLAVHREKCRKLKVQFEDACRALEDPEGTTGREGGGGSVDVRKVEEGTEEEREDDDDGDDAGKGLSIRSYRPFKVLEKRYLSENTLLVFCDLPYYPKKQKDNPSTTLFHLLIRFQQVDGQYLTKAFTPVDMSHLHTSSGSVRSGENLEGDVGKGLEDRMAFLVKLYPSPHATSDMFRALDVYTEPSGGGDNLGVDEDDSEKCKNGVLFLRGPIQTGRDRQRNQQQQQQQQGDNLSLITAGTSTKRHKKRIVMIAAGSGITPMYQVLRALHSQQHHQQPPSSGEVQERGGREEVGEEFWEADEVDLVYCNRTTDDIWLRQELQSFRLSCTDDQKQEDGGVRDQKSEEEISDMAAGMSLSLVRRTTVRVQHVLSSSTLVNQVSKQGGNHQFHTGRINLDLLRNTLQPSLASHDRQEDNKEQLQILVCGPPLFNQDVSAMLASLEYHDSEFCEIHIL
ncbi:MAG: hypothetical protein JOS17DRAFT_726888, partial [Linnemannia elongata]